ncbi:hypothetical protein [Paracoccus jiaweipingae]|uniref:hypothetical protein n=1 Tax=unclassified Paracoccus (in: a-proteobacteria) TaxID=2688777 RepID=UPI0037B52E39
MRPVTLPVLAVSWLTFMASTLAYALLPPAVGGTAGLGLMEGATATAMAHSTQMLLRPQSGMSLWLLLVGCWVTLGRHLTQVAATARRLGVAQRRAHRADLRAIRSDLPPTPRHMLRLHRPDLAWREHLPLVVALLAGAGWPWLVQPAPMAALMLALVMMLAALIAVIRGQRDGRRVARRSGIGLFGGWASLSTLLLFAAFLADRFGLPLQVTQAFAIGIIIVIAMAVQLRIHGTVSFSVAVIWGLIGIAAVTMPVSPSMATLAVAGIAAIALVLVLEVT